MTSKTFESLRIGRYTAQYRVGQTTLWSRFGTVSRRKSRQQLDMDGMDAETEYVTHITSYTIKKRGKY